MRLNHRVDSIVNIKSPAKYSSLGKVTQFYRRWCSCSVCTKGLKTTRGGGGAATDVTTRSYTSNREKEASSDFPNPMVLCVRRSALLMIKATVAMLLLLHIIISFSLAWRFLVLFGSFLTALISWSRPTCTCAFTEDDGKHVGPVCFWTRRIRGEKFTGNCK